MEPPYAFVHWKDTPTCYEEALRQWVVFLGLFSQLIRSTSPHLNTKSSNWHRYSVRSCDIDQHGSPSAFLISNAFVVCRFYRSSCHFKASTSRLCTTFIPSSLVQQIGFVRWRFIRQQVVERSGHQAAWQEPGASPHQSAVGGLSAGACVRLNGTVSWSPAATFHPGQEGKR